MKTKKDSIKKTAQKSTDYRPTAAEKRLLEILLNPAHRLKNVAEMCALAPCVRHVYYNAFKKPAFVEYYRKESRRLIDKARAPIINALIAKAKEGDTPQAKILLTMSGDYTDRMTFPGKDGQPQSIAPQLPHDISIMEKATRVAFLLSSAIKRKEKAEKEQKEKNMK